MALRIAEVARRSGVPATTLRYYDRIGLVPSERESNGYRAYPEDVVDRLRFIDAARRLDFPLTEISDLLKAWEANTCAAVKSALKPRLEAHLGRVDEALADLETLRRDLVSARRHLDELPDRDERCDPRCAFLLTKRQPVVACALGDNAQQLGAWQQLLRNAERCIGGVRCEFPVDRLAEVTELAVAEQACCPFFDFDFALRGAIFVLTIRCPDNALPVLGQLVGADLAA